ncbi:MAG: FprA family A-type flavoprotein [Hadesarchaea archaeon]|nr:FprA family A-type flavoprotein [Hadesarchaea archaeon]
MSKAIEIVPGIFWVGVEDWHRRMFDALIPLPYGTSYNAYLVIGSKKTALIDTVNPGFEDVLFEKIEQVVKPEGIDYVIMNHAEPDHAGSIPVVLSRAKDAKLVATKKGAEMAEAFYGVPPSRVEVVRDGGSLDLGGRTLSFIEAPWLHWPETMFTFCREAGVLFPCDFFGSHLASSRLFDDEVGDILLPEAKRYYADIMMPFSRFVAMALDKVKGMDVRMIAPSHGPIYRNPRKIIDAYERWARGPLERKALVIYVSMWGNTEALAKTIADAISSEGVEAVPYDMLKADLSHIARDLVDASAIVVGSPTLLAGIHPLVGLAVSLVKGLRPRAKLAAIFGSYGWAGGAVDQIEGLLRQAGLEVVGTLKVRGRPTREVLEKAMNLGKLIAKKVKEATDRN